MNQQQQSHLLRTDSSWIRARTQLNLVQVDNILCTKTFSTWHFHSSAFSDTWWRSLLTRLNQPIMQITWLYDAFGKQICHIYPQCSNQTVKYLKNASGWWGWQKCLLLWKHASFSLLIKQQWKKDNLHMQCGVHGADKPPWYIVNIPLCSVHSVSDNINYNSHAYLSV